MDELQNLGTQLVCESLLALPDWSLIGPYFFGGRLRRKWDRQILNNKKLPADCKCQQRLSTHNGETIPRRKWMVSSYSHGLQSLDKAQQGWSWHKICCFDAWNKIEKYITCSLPSINLFYRKYTSALLTLLSMALFTNGHHLSNLTIVIQLFLRSYHRLLAYKFTLPAKTVYFDLCNAR